MEKQVDIFNPLASLEWQKVTSLPATMRATSCVFWRDKIYVSTFVKSNACLVKLYMSSTDLKSWTEFDMPTCSCTLTTYQSRLVLVGGKEIHTDKPTTKLWTSDTGAIWEPSNSLPPTPTHRSFPSVVNTGSPEYLVIAGDTRMSSAAGTVEILIEGQWWTVPKFTSFIYNNSIALHNRKLYVISLKGAGVCYYCELKSLIVACTQSHATAETNLYPLWKMLPLPEEVSLHIVPCSIVSFQQQLICVSYRKILAFFPLTQSWVHVGVPPNFTTPLIQPLDRQLNATATRLRCSLVLPTGDWVGFLHESVFRVSLKASAYDPNGPFGWSALSKLDVAGFPVTTVTRTHEELASLARLLQDHHSITWRSYHDTLKEVDLEELSQQIQKYLRYERSLKEQCTSVIISALLQQRSLEPDQLHVRLPNYVPTMVKYSITRIIKAHVHHHNCQ